MKVALHSVLHEGHEADYDRDHARVPDDLAALFARAGITDWSIWRSGRDLFHVVECAGDFAEAMAVVGPDEANVAWQEFIGVHVERFVPADLTPLPQ
ncbi:MAG: L-rhamnose mutarotase, partial [Propionibacteriaceae bacterium]|nr:L-rhamnose mutarotase [Propionibacteriaceae bacterium]